MPDGTTPARYRPGDPISSRQLTKLGEASVQKISAVGGVVRRAGNCVSIEIQPRGRGGSDSGFYGKMVGCPNVTTRICTVHKITGTWGSTTEDSEDIEAYAPAGCLTRMPDHLYCYVAYCEGMEPPWLVIDIINHGLRAAATGDYDPITSTTLAPYQYDPDAVTCVE